MDLFEQVRATKEFLQQRTAILPRIGIILGSGLGLFAQTFHDSISIPYNDIPGFPPSSVQGHAGRLVFGALNGVPLVAMQGRAHLYEGHSPMQVSFPARVLCALGIGSLVVTNAAGGIRADLSPGDLMIISDHINFTGQNPLTGANDDRLGPRFPDMSATYHPGLRNLLRTTADKLGLSLKEGVYAWVGGPSYETPAEIRMLRALGADSVGMSTVPEVIVARHQGVRVAGVSCITNLAAGVGTRPLSHAEVAETAERSRDGFATLLTHFLPAAARLDDMVSHA